MNILMILANPFITDARVRNEAKSLLLAGHKVTVIANVKGKECSSEEYVDGTKVIKINTPQLTIFLPSSFERAKLSFAELKTYKKSIKEWIFDGNGLQISKFIEFVGLIIDFISFGGFNTVPFFELKAYEEAVNLHKQQAFDVIHCHDAYTLPIGVKLKKRFHLPLVYDSHEFFSQMIAGAEGSKKSIKVMVIAKLTGKYCEIKERSLVKEVDSIITVCNPIKSYLSKISNSPIGIVMNCKNILTKEYIAPSNDKFTIIYVGVFSIDRFFPQVIDVIGNIEDVKLICAGPSMQDIIKEKAKRYDNIKFLGVVPYDEVIKKTLEADCSILMLDPKNSQFRIALANKFFESMVCGRPIISTKGTLIGEIVEKEGIGLSIEYNESSLREAIIKLRDNPKIREEMGRKTLRLAIEKYNWENEEKKLLKVYRNIESKLS